MPDNTEDNESEAFVIPFVKIQGNGNDFILIDETDGEVIPDPMKAEFAALYCDRRFGIGADGVLFLSKSDKANIRMRIMQPDKSEAEMCGNGIRCLVKYAYDNDYITETCVVETLAGNLPVELGYNENNEFIAKIDMGKVLYECSEIPAKGGGEYLRKINGYDVYAVNTGVPHAVIFVDSVEKLSIEEIAPSIRYHESFPNGANVNFVEITGKDEISIRTYERGVESETLSCGTGSTASAAVAYKLGKTGSRVKVNTVGGPLVIYLEEDVAFMEGPAATVFTGRIWA
ncbi:diaminopimelate epimerase [Methanolacinia petrolearia DSM 11571]|uniref:Diaminopimelate epimerase n=1 Tax=Methanolacinia petrolearia (strain DSM 11571 / OCM 486 / SEBR 4847) TaxID=679926 RepID=E1RIR0_METP4|nr:diaminopimelate epimerase [Methanolacinia petrolearia]ADN36652.1 diaminopimelate epimerase [Methanolacinia petrolearia DSM 11571]